MQTTETQPLSTWDLKTIKPYNPAREIAQLPYHQKRLEMFIKQCQPDHISLLNITRELIWVKFIRDQVLGYYELLAHSDNQYLDYQVEIEQQLEPGNLSLEYTWLNYLANIPPGQLNSLIQHPKLNKRRGWLLSEHQKAQRRGNANPDILIEIEQRLTFLRGEYYDIFNNTRVIHPATKESLPLGPAVTVKKAEPNDQTREKLGQLIKNSQVELTQKVVPLFASIMANKRKISQEHGVSTLENRLMELDLSIGVLESIRAQAKQHQPILKIHDKNREIITGKPIGPNNFVTRTTEHNIPLHTALKQIESSWNLISPELGKIIRDTLTSSLLINNPRGSNSIFAGMIDDEIFTAVNWNGKPRQRQSLAHEGGHGLNLFYQHQHDPLGMRKDTTVSETTALLSELLLTCYLDKTKPDTSTHAHQYVNGKQYSRLYYLLAKIDFESWAINAATGSDELTENDITSHYQQSLYKWGQWEEAEFYPYEWARQTQLFRKTLGSLDYVAPILLSKIIFNKWKETEQTGSSASFAERLKLFLSVRDSHTTAETFQIMGIDINDSNTYQQAFDSLALPILELNHELKK